MRKKFALKISFCLIILTIITLSLLFNEGISTDDVIRHWRSYSVMLIVLLFLVNLVYLNHLTHRTYGQEHSDDFFTFPINFITAMATIVCFWQIASDADASKEARRRKIMNDLSSFTENIVIGTWEDETMSTPQLQELYANTLGAASGSDSKTFLNKEEWDKNFPSIPYYSYKNNEQKWHYAAKFCQQMVNIIRMFDLHMNFHINKESDREKSMTGAYGGWITGFRMYMQHPLVRNVWEQSKTRYDSPDITAWVQYFVIDTMENDPNYWENHARNWEKSMQEYLKSAPHDTTTVKKLSSARHQKISPTNQQANK